MGVSTILCQISQQKYENLLSDKNELHKLAPNKTFEQAIIECSHLVYNENSIAKDRLSLFEQVLINLLSPSNIELADKRSIPKVLQSLNIIFIHGIKRGMSSESLLFVARCIDEYLVRHPENIDKFSKVNKSLFSSCWNLSIRPSLEAEQKFELTYLAIYFLSLSKDCFSLLCQTCLKLSNYRSSVKRNVHKVFSFYKEMFRRITLTQKGPQISCKISEFSTFLLVIHDFILTAKEADVSDKNVVDDLQILFETISVKFDPEFSHILQSNREFLKNVSVLKSEEALLTETRKLCSNTENSVDADGNLLLFNILFMVQFASNQKMIYLEHSLMLILVEIFKKENISDGYSLESVLGQLERYLRESVKLLTESADEESWRLRSRLLPHLAGLVPASLEPKTQVFIHNIGIHLSNLGALSYKKQLDSFTSDFLAASVLYLKFIYENGPQAAKCEVESVLRKRYGLLKDDLRFTGRFLDSVRACLDAVRLKLLPLSDVIVTWVKCKRDAHKAGHKSLESLCVKDVVDEYVLEHKEAKFDSDEMLLQELNELSKISQDTFEAEKLCAVNLTRSDSFRHRMEGYLSLAKVFWFSGVPQGEQDNQSVGDSTVMAVKQAKNCLRTYSKSRYRDEWLMFEMEARTEFWSYLCHLRVVQEMAQSEVKHKQSEEEKAPCDSAPAPLGEESDPNAAWSRRSAAPGLASFAVQNAVTAHLKRSLAAWNKVVQGGCIKNALAACNTLVSMGFAFKLCGMPFQTAESFALLTSVAKTHQLRLFWVTGIAELLNLTPELISEGVVEALQKDLDAPADSAGSLLPEHVRVYALAAVAFYYYSSRQYSKSISICGKLLSSALMDKCSPNATQAQISVYFVASKLAHLPGSVVGPVSRARSGLSLAVAGARKAIALVGSAAGRNHHDILCWGHEVAWLHHRITAWLGQLCLWTAQPRLARAFLSFAVSLAEKLALPLSTCEWLVMLSEVDLQCEQLDDCRVKMDNLDGLFAAHRSRPADDLAGKVSDPFSAGTSRPPGPKPGEGKARPPKPRAPSDKNKVKVFTDGPTEIENLREGRVSPSFSLDPPPIRLVVAVGDARRVPELAQIDPRNLGPDSPSFQYRERDTTLKGIDCDLDPDACDVCPSDRLQTTVVRANMVMGSIHAHRANFAGAARCFRQANMDLENYIGRRSALQCRMLAILRGGSAVDLVGGVKEEEGGAMTSSVASTLLCLLFNAAEARTMDPAAASQTLFQASSDNLAQTRALNVRFLHENHPVVIQIILQAKAMERARNDRAELRAPAEADAVRDSIEVCQTPVKSFSSPSFKTPMKRSVAVSLWNKPLGKDKHHAAAATPFSIYTDRDARPVHERRRVQGARPPGKIPPRIESPDPELVENSPEYRNGTPRIDVPSPHIFNLKSERGKKSSRVRTRGAGQVVPNAAAKASLFTTVSSSSTRSSRAAKSTSTATVSNGCVATTVKRESTTQAKATSNPAPKESQPKPKLASNAPKQPESPLKPPKIDQKPRTTRSSRMTLKRL